MEIKITLDNKKLTEILHEYRERAEIAEKKLEIVFERIRRDEKLKHDIDFLIQGVERDVKYYSQQNPIVLTLK